MNEDNEDIEWEEVHDFDELYDRYIHRLAGQGEEE